MSSRWLRNSFIYLLILVAVVAIVFSFFRGGDSSKNLTFSEVVAAGREGKLQSIEVSGESLNVKLRNDTTKYNSRVGKSTDVEKVLGDNNVTIGGTGDKSIEIKYKEPSAYGNWIGILISFAPILVFGAILIFMMRQAQGSNSQAMSFGKSRARMFTGNKMTVTFAARGPLGLSTTSNRTLSPSFIVRKPSARISEGPPTSPTRAGSRTKRPLPSTRVSHIGKPRPPFGVPGMLTTLRSWN